MISYISSTHQCKNSPEEPNPETKVQNKERSAISRNILLYQLIYLLCRQNNTDEVLRSCQTIVNGLIVRCECGCCDCYDYLELPLLTACESIIAGFSPGLARDRQFLQILRAGHRPDIEAYVREHRPDLIDRHEAATAIVAEYQATQKLLDKLCAQ